MICIFTTAVDLTTTDVIRWLRHLGTEDVVRINADSPCDAQPGSLEITADSLRFQVGHRTVHLRDIAAAWYWKGRDWLCTGLHLPGTQQTGLSAELQRKLRKEAAVLSEFAHGLIASSVPTLGGPQAATINKLVVLNAATQAGLEVPPFLVTNSRERVTNMLASGERLVAKAMSDGLYYFDRDDGRGYFSYTERLDQRDVEKPTAYVPPSFVQKYIPKRFDVRVFFLEDTCYSMAILSQLDKQTRVDFRKYNEKRPNRNVPYRLPQRVDSQIKRLFKILRLNTGSVDLVVAEDGTHYFLEVNPVGQFGMVSEACNYGLERLVAERLLWYAGQRGA